MLHEDDRIRFREDGEGRCLTARRVESGSYLNAELCEESNEKQLWMIQVRLSQELFESSDHVETRLIRNYCWTQLSEADKLRQHDKLI